MKNNSVMSTPYGDLNSIPGLEKDRYAYIYEGCWEEDGWKPPSAWMVNDATGGRMYFKARDRKKAQSLCDEFYSKGKYSVIADKVAQIR